ncbi:MAG: cell division protein FtsZ [Rikenellaceae bacterium]
MTEEIFAFEFEPKAHNIIMVAGIGGGGGNAVNHMYDLGITDVTFMVCNTDSQALNASPVPLKLQLGAGYGAGNNPEVAKQAARNSVDDIIETFKQEGTKMVFITAGMGGGTGTGAAPVIAKVANELDILTVAIVTLPFSFEGEKRMTQAKRGINELREYVDAILVMDNDKIHEIYGELSVTDAFGQANNLLADAAKGISEIITRVGAVNVDFEDVRTVMTRSGVAMMGTAKASGEGRDVLVAQESVSSPLLNHNYIKGAKDILLNITHGKNPASLSEAGSIVEYVQENSGNGANIIWGLAQDLDLADDEMKVVLIATQFGEEVNDSIFGSDYKLVNSTIHPVGEVPPVGLNTIPLDEVLSESPFSGRDRGLVSAFKDEFVGKVNGQQSLVVHSNNIYSNLALVLSKPAFLRRNMKLDTKLKTGAGKAKKVLLSSESPQETPEFKEVNLFDN